MVMRRERGLRYQQWVAGDVGWEEKKVTRTPGGKRINNPRKREEAERTRRRL